MARTADFEAMAREGSDLSVPGLVAYLDNLDITEVTALLMAPGVVPVIHRTPPGDDVPGPHWKDTDPRPSLADEDPAVMCAIARCAVARWRSSSMFGDVALTASHPERCGWCDYPADELDRALRWSEVYSRLIVSEAYVWRRGASAYRRDSGRAGIHENVRWAAFAALGAREQRYLTDAAVAASRANLDATGPASANGTIIPVAIEGSATSESAGPVAHLPWCDLRPDHAGDCPAPPPD